MASTARRDAARGAARPSGRARASQLVRVVDRLTIAAIGVVVALVSVPRLKSLALRENERDASQTLRLLGATLASPAWDLEAASLVGPPVPSPVPSPMPSPMPSMGETATAPPATVGELFLSTPSVARRLEDTELLDHGRLLRRHGYLFDLTFDGGAPLLRAWPWCYGETGLGAFSYSAELGLVGHPNAEPRWCGPEHAPPMPRPSAGWLRLP